MKKTVKRLIPLLLVLVLTLGAVPAAALSRPELKIDITDRFTDANFLAEVRSALGKGPADRVYTSDVSKISSLSVAAKGISSLAGIEYFFGLETLGCNHNSLSELDLRKNTKLKTIYCYGNSLTKLDVSKNTQLELLWCMGNKLSSLDLSENLNLKELSCYNNQLTKLNVSNNTQLTYLNCDENWLSALDVSKNTKLESLSCGKNELSALDVSKNPGLLRLSLTDNWLTTLDVSNHPDLETLSCGKNKLTALDVSRNPKLKSLYCEGNRLTALDMGTNPLLVELHCYQNELSFLDVSSCPKLRYLDCEDNRLTALDVSENPLLETLCCGGNQLGTLDVSGNTKLENLYCVNNYMPSEDSIIGLDKAKTTFFKFTPQAPLPSPPQNLSAQPGDGSVDLSWTMPAYGGSSALTGFEVSDNKGATWIATGSTSSHSFSGLENGQGYIFRVRAVNGNGKGLEAEIQAVPGAPVIDTPPPLPPTTPEYGEASDWAKPELDKAATAGLIPEILQKKDMRESISREEFAELAVQLYETATGKSILVINANPFTDTTNYQILKAYQVGITAGTSETSFSPKTLISREQCATMLYRAIKAIAPNADYSTAGIADFPDQEHIASWAVEGTKYMSKLGIILGDTRGYFMPRPLTPEHEVSGYGMASREAAVLMTIRTFEKIK